MKVKIYFKDKIKPLRVDIVQFDSNGSKDKIKDAHEYRTWLNGCYGKFVSIGNRIISLDNIIHIEILK